MPLAFCRDCIFILNKTYNFESTFISLFIIIIIIIIIIIYLFIYFFVLLLLYLGQTCKNVPLARTLGRS